MDKINSYKEYDGGVKINELELCVANTDEAKKHNAQQKKPFEEGKGRV